MNEEMYNDRWFKLKVDSLISDIANAHWRNDNSFYYSKRKPKKWYEYDILWNQVCEELSAGTKYTHEEVVEYMKSLQSAAKLEALLDEDS
ncbi:hypothetical protein PYDG_00025 [Pseudoalteromonas phage pYD6-A]|uniref:Uncharacterized protein n=1 Tax=Pseudoalteromonas phage pYD6-A TaxID=754052 RepID=M4SMG4_9CAUD|nr:hypothetical protein PYDG_00025 [Pseudoalteromonas phage pYD6-A]AGH57557.1 hypothetical protein PYDG_00025 [Pseudoalteromonas phage pYD6-A]